MSERSIFLNALDRKDPTDRAAYLDEACAGRPQLRCRIERLLRAQVHDSFLEVPAPEQLALAEQALSFLAPPGEPGALGRLDHYDVLEVVGRGATGVVLKARDSKLQRVVALKVLAPRLAVSRTARERFVREAQATAAVRDDNVIAIYAVSDEGALPYLVMEFIAGVTLENRIKNGSPLKLAEILRIGLQAASGLAVAHAQGLIHRDIKPANILLENGVPRVKITDFGLAQAAAGVPSQHGVIAGTPSFMAPCQARGEPPTERSDLFSLGAVLYTLCAGRPPFGGDTIAAVLKSVCEDTPRPVRAARPDLPESLCDLVGKLLAKDPKDRFGSAREVADVLTAQLARLQQPVPPPERSGPAPARPSSWRARLLLACLVALLAGLAALAAILKPWQHWAPGAGSGDATAREGGRPAESLNLRRDDIPARLLALAGGGDPAKAPRELAAVLGDGRFLLPRVGQTSWMEQSPDGKLLAVPLDEDVALFDVASGTYLRTLKGPGGRAIAVTFSRDNQLLAATSRYETGGGSLRVWDLRADGVLYTNPQPGSAVSCAAAFSADGKRLITEVDGRLRLQDARSGQGLQDVDMRPGRIAWIDVSPDGRRVAVASWYGKAVKVFDWEEGGLAEVRTLPHLGHVAVVAFSPDGKLLASGDLTRLTLWDAGSLEEVFTAEAEAEQLAFAPDGRTLFAAATTGQARAAFTFRRWEVAARKQLSPLTVDVGVERARAFHRLSRDGKVLFVARQFGATHVQAIDSGDGKELFPPRGHAAALNAVAVSPDGQTVASAGEDWTVKLWDLATGRVRHSLNVHTGAVGGLAFSPDGKRLASGSRDGTIALWDVGSGTVVRALLGHSRAVSRVWFSPDGRTLTAGGERGAVKLWDAESGKEREPLPGHAGVVRCVAFNAAGTLLASGGEDRRVCLHDLAGGGTRTFDMPAAVNEVTFSPDGRTLAAVGDAPEAVVRLCDLETGAETTGRGHTAHVLGLAFSPSAPLLATCGADDTVRLWEPGHESAVRTIGPGPFGGAVGAVAFTPDGRYLVTANANGLLYVLRVQDDAGG